MYIIETVILSLQTFTPAFKYGSCPMKKKKLPRRKIRKKTFGKKNRNTKLPEEDTSVFDAFLRVFDSPDK